MSKIAAVVEEVADDAVVGGDVVVAVDAAVAVEPH